MKTILSVLSALLLIGTASGQTGPYNRKASHVLFAPNATGGVSVSFVGEILAPNGVGIGEDASTMAQLYVNGTLQSIQSWTILTDGGTSSCSLDCGSDCGAMYVDGVFNNMTCHEIDNDCQCGHWIKWDTGYEPNVEDEIMVLLMPASGALPDADPSDDQLIETFDGEPTGWNRRLNFVQVENNGDGTANIHLDGHLVLSNIGASGKTSTPLNLGTEVGIETVAGYQFYTTIEAVKQNDGPVGCDQGCNGQPCGTFAGNGFVWPTGICGPWLGWIGCSCGTPFDIELPNVPLPPGGQIKIILKPAPGALPELPGFPEEDDEREPPRDPATGVDGPRMVALQLESFPNPFNPATTLRFDLPQAAKATLAIYDVRGQQVRSLLNENLPAGESSVRWNGLDERGDSVSSGNYYARLDAGGHMEVVRLSLIK